MSPGRISLLAESIFISGFVDNRCGTELRDFLILDFFYILLDFFNIWVRKQQVWQRAATFFCIIAFFFTSGFVGSRCGAYCETKHKCVCV